MNDLLIRRTQIFLPIVASPVLAPDCGDHGSAARARTPETSRRLQQPATTLALQFQSANCFQFRPLSISILNTCKIKPIQICVQKAFFILKNQNVVISLGNVHRGGTQEFELRSIKFKKYISGLGSIFLFQKKHNFAQKPH